MKVLRKYGKAPFSITVIHGGPGAAGEMAPVARELALSAGILEPLQNAGSLEGQLDELYKILQEHGNLPVTMVGFSWGAILSFIFASRHPSLVKKLVLIGSSPFEEKYASRIMETRFNRMNDEERLKAHDLTEALNDPCTKDKNTILAQFGELLTGADSFQLLPFEKEIIDCQYEVFQGVWEEARALRQSGRLLQLGKKIQCPVVAIHGDYDPHPYEGVQEPLSKIIKDFRLFLLKKCGHKPWLEKAARDRFFRILREELI